MANGELNVKSREDWVAAYKRAARLRNANASIGPDEYYDVAAKNLADQLIVISADARVIAGKISLQDRTGTQLDEIGRPIAEGGIGLPRPGAEGASGALIIQTTASGTDVVSGATLKSSVGVSYHVVNSEHRSNGDTFAVVCDEDGPQTNLDAGAKLTWDSPPPGCYATATVVEQSGEGLFGGREEMGDDDYRELLADAIANPAASANDAELQRLIQDSRGHGVAVEKAFTYSAMLGFGITGFTFTMRGSADLDSRLPSADQLNIVAAHVEGNLPATDGLVKIPLIVDPVNLAFRVKWSSNGWTNAVQWPPYMTSGSRYAVYSVGANTTVVSIIDSIYSGRAAPQVGQVIGLFGVSTGKFRRKTIAVVTGTGPWTLTFDATTTGASDLGYTPVPGQWVVPWSDSLNSVAELVVAHVNAMGPGEISINLPEDGFRMARSPKASTLQWPNEMDSRLLGSITALPSVQRATHEDGADHVTLVGSAVAVYLMTIGDIGIYPL